MCIICAAIPATAALGAKLNTNQLGKPGEKRLPVLKITGIIIGMLVIASALYHTFRWRS